MTRFLSGVLILASAVCCLVFAGSGTPRAEESPQRLADTGPSGPREKPAINYAKALDSAIWHWVPEMASPLYCVTQCGNHYDIRLLSRKSDRHSLIVTVFADDREIYTWKGHRHSVFRILEDRLYYARFHPSGSGGSVVAVDLKAGKELWASPLKALGPIRHSSYLNLMILTAGFDEVGIHGNESMGRYIEIKSAATGETLAHRVFPKEDGAHKSGGEQPDAAASKTASPPAHPALRGPLRLSEVTLDGADGSADWWVELYNSSDRAVDATGVTVVVSGKAVATVPGADPAKNVQATTVPPRGLLLIRLDRKEAHAEPPAAPAPARTPTITVSPSYPQGRPPAPDREPGYCALFDAPSLTREALVDLAQWGHFEQGKPRPDWPHEKWAEKQEVWERDRGVSIGVPEVPGEKMPPPAGSTICRHQFSSRRANGEMWIVCRPTYTTPGAGNVVPPPLIHSPFGGHAADGPLMVSFRWYDIPRLIAYGADTSAEKPYHFQIAIDPMFERIVFDTRYPDGAQSIPQGQLKAGGYWARVRYDSPRLSTGWCEPRPFYYR